MKEDSDLLISNQSDKDNFISNERDYYSQNFRKKSSSQKRITMILVISLAIICFIAIFILFFIKTENKNNSSSNSQKKLGNFHNPIPDSEDLDFTEEEHRLLSRQIATQTMVLATNKNNILPLRKTDQVVLFGEGTVKTIYGGTGAGQVYDKGTSVNLTPIKVLEGIENKKDKFIYIENKIGYEIGLHQSNLTEADIEQFAVKRENAERTIALITISRQSGEGSDRQQDKSSTGTLLKDTELATYNAIIKYFDKVVLILNVGSVIELNDIDKNENVSILISFLPGMEAGNAIADVLVGDANPSGHLTDTWAKTINDYPTTSTFLESPQYVKYKEGLFVGYRYFEDNKDTQEKVVFPFGHGLSYTDFSVVNNCEFKEDKNIFEIKSEIKNIGNRSGKQVIQVYVKKPQNEKFIKVQRELVMFGKTKELEPGEIQDLYLSFDLNSLASYDDTGVTGNRACYVLEKGEYLIYVGTSVADTRNENNLVYKYVQKELKIVEKLHNRLVPHDPEVADANKKPNFTQILSNNEVNNNHILEYNRDVKKSSHNSNKLKNNEEKSYNNLPTNKFNEINFKSVLENKYTMEQLIDTMSNEELAYLSYGKKENIRHGTGIIGGSYNSGITGKYNIPGGDTLDGPAGLRQSEKILGSTAWPCSTALASSFDIDLMKKVGEETGKEARKLGCYFWLAPGMNIHRNPLCGRNFEYYSEDPLLTGLMATAITQGLQSKRVSITLKHFVANNKEINRNGEFDPNGLASDSRMAERVAREIYLKGFEIAIKKGKPWSLMTSYNRINGMKTSESYDLLTGILRDEWGYDGLVMTDWTTKSKNDREAHAGNGVKMPNNGNDETSTILNGLIVGSVTRNELKRNILYVFKTLAKTAAIDKLFIEPKNIIKINETNIKIKIFDNIYQKSSGISHEDCKDDDGGENPTNTMSNSWISIFVESDKEQYRMVRIRYASNADGFGVSFNKYGENLGEITNLENTNGKQKWKNSSYTVIKFPKGKYELILRFLGYDYKTGENTNKGNINYLEIMEM